MATEKEANKAREQHAALLESLGVHAIGVDEIGKKGLKNFGVIAFVEKPNKKLPTELKILSGKKEIKVPLVAQISNEFQAE